MTFAPTFIDLSRIAAPNVIEPLDYETLRSNFIDRFRTAWASARAADPSLPDYDVQMLESDPAIIFGEAWSYERLLDRARVNDAGRAVLAPLARGADLDNVVARWNVQRLAVVDNPRLFSTNPEDWESDSQLLRRYLMAVDRPSAGSADRYLYEAFTAFPTMQDAVVLGRAVHGRPGDTEIVISGPNGDNPTTGQIAAVLAAVTATDVKPEAVSVTVLAATRQTYTLALTLEIPKGPDPNIVIADARTRIEAAIAERLMIGAEVPVWSVAGAAYGPNVIRVSVTSPAADIAADRYTIPVCTGISLTADVQA